MPYGVSDNSFRHAQGFKGNFRNFGRFLGWTV